MKIVPYEPKKEDERVLRITVRRPSYRDNVVEVICVYEDGKLLPGCIIATISVDGIRRERDLHELGGFPLDIDSNIKEH